MHLQAVSVSADHFQPRRDPVGLRAVGRGAGPIKAVLSSTPTIERRARVRSDCTRDVNYIVTIEFRSIMCLKRICGYAHGPGCRRNLD